jgi:EmrB/QacA subfamily drug resistance transporter
MLANHRRPAILAAVIAAMFMIAIEATIVATAMPQIASELGDLNLYAWVFSAFLLAQTATTVAFGKLADIYGRKPIILVGIGIFLVGTLLCGFAWSMKSLILFRLVQGFGSGAIQPVCLTIVGDLYTPIERGRIQGYLASAWGISSVLGPLAGGLIIQQASWAWIFWINVPVGLAAAAAFIAFLHEDRRGERRRVDIAGGALFTFAVAASMMAITEAGTSDWAGALAAAAACAVGAVAFMLQERRAVDPMMDFRLWMRRPIATGNAVVLFASMAVIGLTAFLPIYVQAVLNRSALVAGFTLTMMVLGWPIGTTIAARNFTRFGLRAILLFGAALMPLGALTFLFLGPATSPLVPAAGSAVMGLGMGFLSVSAIVMIQESASLAERGVATASNIFARNLGSTLGATALGGALNIGMNRHGGVDFDQVRQLLDHPLNQSAGAIGNPAIRVALGQALHLTFAAMFVLAALTFCLALLVPSVALRQSAKQMASAE